MNSTLHDDRIPVIVGVGQLLNRPGDGEEALDPLKLIINAIDLANEDSQGKFLTLTDSIDIEHITSRIYDQIGETLIQHYGLTHARSVYHDVSGELPVKHLCAAANRIADGKSQVAIICGAESAWSARHARLLHTAIPGWSGKPQGPSFWKPNVDHNVSQYRLHIPVRAYALYENACRTHWHQTLLESQEETAALQERASLIASMNEFSWSRQRKTKEEIITPSPKNKMLAWPYSKLMVANNYLNCGTAIILTNLRTAKQLGIETNRLIYVYGGAHASEPSNIFLRDNYYHSAAMEAVFDAIFQTHQLQKEAIDFAEIYSCFPCVTKMARRIIQFDSEKDLTITGGMTFCRAQFSNFMSQAIVSMVNKLRTGGKHGLLYGNGHYLTHAAGAVISNVRPSSQLLPLNLDVQHDANSRMGSIPPFIEDYNGAATVETYTVVFDQDGMPQQAIMIARTPNNCRFAAMSKEGDARTYLPLLDPAQEVIGRVGQSLSVEGINIWSW